MGSGYVATSRLALAAPSHRCSITSEVHQKTQSDYEAMAQALASDDFDESQHPRDDHGRFGEGTGEKSGEKIAVALAKIEKPHEEQMREKFATANAERVNQGLPALTESEAQSTGLYTNGSYYDMNQPTRAGTAFGMLDKRTVDKIHDLDRAIDKSPLKENMELYRGISAHSAREMFGGDGLKVGALIQDKGFVSTSKDLSVADKWADRTDNAGMRGVRVIIEAKAGQRGLDATKFSVDSKEKEVILPRDSQFTVIGVKEVNHGYGPTEVRCVYES